MFDYENFIILLNIFSSLCNKLVDAEIFTRKGGPQAPKTMCTCSQTTGVFLSYLTPRLTDIFGPLNKKRSEKMVNTKL